MKLIKTDMHKSQVVSHFGPNIVTSCDTTSFSDGIGKIKPSKKMIKNYAQDVLGSTENSLSPVHKIETATKLFHQMMYNGKITEDVTPTCVRVYQQQKTKTR